MISVSTARLSPENWRDTNLFLQTAYWARLKQRFGWRPMFLSVATDESESIPAPTRERDTGSEAPVRSQPTDSYNLLVLSRKVAPGVTLAYVPGGPPLPTVPGDLRGEYLSTVAGQIAESMAPLTPTAIRFDLPWRDDAAPREGDRLRKSPVDVQPPDTVVLDLQKSEDELLAGMKSRCRRNIRKSQKRGVEVVVSKSVDDFYDLYRQTAERDRIAIHSHAYYQAVLDEADATVAVELLLAQVESENVAGIIVAYTPGQAVYLYGAGGNRHRDAMPAYALQWEAIQRARIRGCSSYDLFGIPPTDDPDHPMHGLLLFKTGFGGETVHRAGCWDYPVQRLRYFLFREAEGARQFYYKKLRKRR